MHKFDPIPTVDYCCLAGKPLPFAKPAFAFAPTGNLLASPWKFKKYGPSGIEVSDLFPLSGRASTTSVSSGRSTAATRSRTARPCSP